MDGAEFKEAEYESGINSFLDLLNMRLMAAGSLNPATDEDISGRHRIDEPRR